MWKALLAATVLLALTSASFAELQNVEVGGEVRIRGRWWRNGFAGRTLVGTPRAFVPKRPIGPFALTSLYDWDDRGNDRKIIEQRTHLNVRADFTDEVAAFVELDSYSVWGEDFRSNWITGVDSRANSIDDLEVYQAYIEVNELFGQPLRLRIGRQDLVMGKGWLVGNQISPTLGVSFDAIRLTYAVDQFSVDAWCAKLVDTGFVEEDGDVDFYGIYATYRGFEPVELSAYWFWVRDARQLNDTNFVWFVEWLEDIFGVDDYDVTNLHTIGIRANGECAAFDYDLELAYQFGNADAVGAGFAPFIWGDDEADFDAWAADLEVGYTFDMAWQPRVFLGGAYFEGEDNRDLSFWDWVNPLYDPEASVSFNRLFSKIWYTANFDILGGAAAFSNFYQLRGGVAVHPTETIAAGLNLAYFWVDEPFDAPVSFDLLGFRVPIAPALSFWTQEVDDDIGLVSHIWLKYDYSEDLFFKVGWEHLFTDDGMSDGNFVFRNGLMSSQGTDDDGADYIYFDTGLKF